jgi:hypothetical protein
LKYIGVFLFIFVKVKIKTMAKIKIHGVSINTDAFKSASDVKTANLFSHLGEGAKQAENELLEVLNIVDKKPKKVKEVVEEPAAEIVEVEAPKTEEDATEWPKNTI